MNSQTNDNLFNYYSINSIDEENILLQLSLINDFFEFSIIIERISSGKHFIANPSGASSFDRESCLNDMQELILNSLKGLKDRKNGRAKKLYDALSHNNLILLANLIASRSWNYWEKRGFKIETKNGRMQIAMRYQYDNKENKQQKNDFQKVQFEFIGAAVGFEKARKKGAFQEIFDFFESEEILKNNDFED